MLTEYQKRRGYKIIPHPYRGNGHHLVFPNGDTWSLVNLGMDPRRLDEPLPTDPKLISLIKHTWKDIGEMYDGMGGRYEGLGPKDEIVRNHSFESLVQDIISNPFLP